MTNRRKLLAAGALAVAAAAAGCLDALAPGAPHRVARVGLVPVFEGRAGLALPGDVDSIAITIHNPNPPPPDTTVGLRVAPGQDPIVVSIDIPLSGAGSDTRTLSFAAIRSSDGMVLYSGSEDVVVRAGVPTHADSVRVNYVGPGRNIAALTLSPSTVALKPGDAFSAWSVVAIDSSEATIPDESAPPVIWRSRDPQVATVDASGTTRGVADGQTHVVAISGARSSVRDSALVVVSASPVAVIALAPTTAAFTATAGGANPASQTVAVTNGGLGALSGLSVSGITYGASEPTGWLNASLTATTAPATLTLQPATGTLTAGTYHATVSVASALASNSPQGVAVTFTVVAGPAIGLSPSAVTILDTVTTSDPAPVTVAVTNAGGGSLAGLAVGTIGYVGASGWLTATLNQATAPATLTLTAAKGALGPGTYTATVPVTSPVAGNSPQTVTVTFTIAPLPLIGLAPASVTFVDTLATADPAAQTVAVTNAGTGTLSGLAVGTISYGSGSGWLTATLNQSTAPATLTLSVAKGALAAGTYTATVPVTSAAAGNSPQSVAVTFTILPSVATLARIVVTPGYGVVAPAGTLALAVQGLDAGGGTVATPGLQYVSRTPGVATVDNLTGLVTGVAGGTAVILASAPGGAGTVYDSTLVAVTPSGVAVALPVSNGRAFGDVLVGDTVHVIVTADIGAATGELLGSYNAQLDWDPAVLQYVRTTAVTFTANTTLNETATASGSLRFGASDPNGVAGPSIALVDVVFVASAAGASPTTLTLTDLSGISPTFTQMLTQALVCSGAVQVK